jgi:hypothetical protein
MKEVDDLLDQLDAVLASELFREIGELSKFPADDQVLQKREGYRDIYRAYIQFEVASKLSWQGGESIYGAGQRDVATLYEYWAFLALAQQLAIVLDVRFDFARLIEVRQGGLNVALKTGSECVLHGVTYGTGERSQLNCGLTRRSESDHAPTAHGVEACVQTIRSQSNRAPEKRQGLSQLCCILTLSIGSTS